MCDANLNRFRSWFSFFLFSFVYFDFFYSTSKESTINIIKLINSNYIIYEPIVLFRGKGEPHLLETLKLTVINHATSLYFFHKTFTSFSTFLLKIQKIILIYKLKIKIKFYFLIFNTSIQTITEIMPHLFVNIQ